MINIYLIENQINYKIYIGITGNLNKRISTHKSIARKENRANNSAVHSAIRKYGWDNFDVLVLESTSNKEEAKKLEKYYISFFDTYNGIGYNCTAGGDSFLCGKDHPLYGVQGEDHPSYGRHHSKRARKEISKKTSGENNPFYGKTHSKESRNKMSKNSEGGNFAGRSHTQESKKKISDANKGIRNKSKLEKIEAREVKWLSINSSKTQESIGEEYNIDQTTVSYIKRDKLWAGIDPKNPY